MVELQIVNGRKMAPVHRLRFRASGLAVWRPNRDGVAFPASAGPWEITMVMQDEELVHLREEIARANQSGPTGPDPHENWPRVGRLLTELLAAGVQVTLHGGPGGWEACADTASQGAVDPCKAPTLTEAVERLHALVMSRQRVARKQEVEEQAPRSLTPDEAFVLVYRYVQEHGKLDPPAPPGFRMGGIWHADIWRLGDLSAWLTDDGAAQMIQAPGLEVLKVLDRDLKFLRGTPEQLVALAQTLSQSAQGGSSN